MKKNLPASKKGFTLIELLISITIIGILSSIGLSTFSSAQRKSQDAKRKSDLNAISQALETYYNDHQRYPADEDGQIVGCTTADSAVEIACEWGSPFQSLYTNPDTVYLVELPQDSSLGLTYYYDAISSNLAYQLYARLENTADSSIPQDASDNPQNYGLACGTENCNYGISSANTTPATNRSLTTE